MGWIGYSFLTAFFESVTNALGKNGAQKIDVLSVVWAQRFFALFLMIPLLLFTHSLQNVNTTFWMALLATTLLNTISHILFVKTVKDSPLSLTLPLISLTPVFLLITSPIMLGEFPKPLGIAGILSAVVGAYILNLSKRSGGILMPFASLVKDTGSRSMILVAFIWSITSNFDKIAVQNSNPILFAFSTTCMTLFFMTCILMIKKISFKNIFKNSAVLAPIGISAGLSVIFQMTAISLTLVANVSTIKRTSSIFAILWGKFFFHEENIKERLAGAVIMIIGVALILLSK